MDLLPILIGLVVLVIILAVLVVLLLIWYAIRKTGLGRVMERCAISTTGLESIRKIYFD